MYDKSEEISEKYDFKVQDTTKGRGILILHTENGLKALKEYKGSGRHLIWSQEVLEKIHQEQGLFVDSCVRNTEGDFITQAADGSKYIIKNWYEARECDVKKTEDLYMAVRGLAVLHNRMEKVNVAEKLYVAKDLAEEFNAHNQEIRRVRKYLYGKNNRTEFETLAANCCDMFIGEGKEAIDHLKEFKPDSKLEKGLCHGNYNFHNVSFQGDIPVIVNFEKQNYNYLMADLYCFLRKIMEKSDWDTGLGSRMINEYDRERTIGKADLELLAIMFSYPEKFWKLLNGYFNSNKAWVPRKKLEKLEKLVDQNRYRLEFIKTIYS